MHRDIRHAGRLEDLRNPEQTVLELASEPPLPIFERPSKFETRPLDFRQYHSRGVIVGDLLFGKLLRAKKKIGVSFSDWIVS